MITTWEEIPTLWGEAPSNRLRGYKVFTLSSLSTKVDIRRLRSSRRTSVPCILFLSFNPNL